MNNLFENEEIKEEIKDIGVELLKQIGKTILIGGAVRVSNVIIKRTKNKGTKHNVYINIKTTPKEIVKKAIKETGECFVVGSAARIGRKLTSVIKESCNKTDTDLTQQVRKLKYAIDEFKNSEEV